MNYWKELIIMSFGISLILTGIIIPQVLLIAFRRKLFDAPDGRKIHKAAVPRLGGVAFLPAVFCAVALSLGTGFKFPVCPSFVDITADIEPLLFAVCSTMLLYLAGMADDLVGVRYRAKFFIQIICAMLTVLSGVYFTDLYGLLGLHGLPLWGTVLLSGFMVVYIINAVNLIDGIDGLASGICMIALGFYGWIFYIDGRFLHSMVSWATCGTILTFLYYNLLGKESRHKKIFMGDTGSLTIGMLVAFLSIEIARQPAPAALADCNPMLIAFSPLIVPMFDVVRVCLHRLKQKRNPFLPDKSHIHHKLLAAGLSPSMALTVILLAMAIFVGLNVGLSPWVDINILVGCDILLWLLLNEWLTRQIRQREKLHGQQLYK